MPAVAELVSLISLSSNTGSVPYQYRYRYLATLYSYCTVYGTGTCTSTGNGVHSCMHLGKALDALISRIYSYAADPHQLPHLYHYM